MNRPSFRSASMLRRTLRSPLTWITLLMLLAIAGATAAVAVELYQATGEPMQYDNR